MTGRRRRTFSEAQLTRLREVAERVRVARGWNQEEIAARLGIKQPTYSKFILGDGTSGPVARAIGELAGMSLAELLEAPSKPTTTGDPYPNRTRALQAARLVGLSDRAVECLSRLEPPGGPSVPEPSALAYFEHALQIHRVGEGVLVPRTESAAPADARKRAR